MSRVCLVFAQFREVRFQDLPGVGGLYLRHLRNWSVNISNLAGMVMTKIEV
jgi:hypothetical protein